MPIQLGQDMKGYFFQYGSQKKYHFKTKTGGEKALAKAKKQELAIRLSRLRKVGKI